MFLLFAVDPSNNGKLQGAYTDQEIAKKEADRIYAAWQTNQANVGSRLIVSDVPDSYTVPSPSKTKA